jgi:hypothetical protein
MFHHAYSLVRTENICPVPRRLAVKYLFLTNDGLEEHHPEKMEVGGKFYFEGFRA